MKKMIAFTATIMLLCTTSLSAQSSTDTETGIPAQSATNSVLTTPSTVRTAWNNAFVELGGNGFLGSLNYERLITNWLSVRLGYNPILYPVMFLTTNILIGESEHKFQAGIGLLTNLGFTGTIGYRYQPQTNGLLFRIGFTPIFRVQLFSSAYSDLPWGGISVGYTF